MMEMLRILERVIAPAQGDLSPEVARGLLELSFSKADQDHYQDLAARHSNGELSAQELAELRGYVDANTFLMLLQSKARRSLSERQPAA
jgi:hypothetical protein